MRKEVLIAFICIFVAAVAIIVCAHILLSQNVSDSNSESSDTEATFFEDIPKATYSPQSPKSLEFKSLGVGKCAVSGIGGYEGTDLKIPERNPEGEKFSEREIKIQINKIDKDRAKYYEYYTSQRWGDIRNYDLCINTTGLDIKNIVPHVAKMFAEK